MIPGVNVSRMLARTGVDWILVDCEFVLFGDFWIDLKSLVLVG